MNNILEVNGLVKRYPAFSLTIFPFRCRKDVLPALSEPMAQEKPRQYALFSTLHTKTPGQ